LDQVGRLKTAVEEILPEAKVLFIRLFKFYPNCLACLSAFINVLLPSQGHIQPFADAVQADCEGKNLLVYFYVFEKVFCLQDDPLYLIFVIKKYVVKN
jgi:hypothetical protein